MSGVPAKRAATYEDLLRVPEHLVAEIIDGDLVTSPRPAAVATDALGRRGRDCSSERWRTSNGLGGCARSRLLFRWCRGVDLAQGGQGVVGVVNFAVRRPLVPGLARQSRVLGENRERALEKGDHARRRRGALVQAAPFGQPDGPIA